MMKWSLLAAGILGCATPAHAQFGTPNSFNVDLQVSTDNGTTWGDQAVISDAGGALMMRILLSADRSSSQSQVVSIAGFTMTQINVEGSEPGDFISDLWLAPTAANTDLWDISLQGDRIDRVMDPDTQNLGVLQPPIAQGGSTDVPWAAAGFSFNVAASGPRTIEISAPSSAFTYAAAWIDTTQSAGIFGSSRCYFHGVTVTVVPAPASAILVGLAGLGASRRRR